MALQPNPQRMPATVIRTRGPIRSISHPSNGCTNVCSRMKSVNAPWTSDCCQPLAARIGPTNRVQAYCRLAIITIAISDATS